MIAILYWMYCLPKNNISSYTLDNNYIVPLYPKLASLLAFHCISCAKYNLLATLFLVLPWQHVPFLVLQHPHSHLQKRAHDRACLQYPFLHYCEAMNNMYPLFTTLITFDH